MKAPALILASALLSSLAVSAQVVEVTVKPLTDEDIKLIRQDIQSAKDEIIKNTMEFSQAEATAFWPVYKEYASEQRTVADKRLALILEYANKIDTLSDAEAKSLTQKFFQTEEDAQALRKKYFTKFEAALGAKRAAKFYQVDNRLAMILNVQLASEIPLIP